ncbi:MAG: hypothetical protein JNM57_01210 [Cyclobacteriaceae bacterium]|nr:hypothetical protein [Cyclobacteriaceae bacterium]
MSTVVSLQCLGQEWKFTDNTAKAYELVLNLQPEEALQAIPEPRTAQELYIFGLAEAIELLITEDAEKFSAYEDIYETRIEKRAKGSDADHLFMQAELRLQWAFVYLKYGHEFDAALNLKQAYSITEECKKKFPAYLAIKKTSGLLQIIIGSVPEKYNWVLGLLGIEGSIQTGLDELDAVRKSNSALRFEADLLFSLVQGFVFQQPEIAVQELKKLIEERPESHLTLFLGGALAIKNSQSEEALKMLSHLSEGNQSFPLYYADYLKGEIYLHKADYLNAITSYRWFINHYTGQNYIKDAYYKIGLCYWLNGNTSDAQAMFKEARMKGKEESEADKYAARSLAETELPHVKLSKVRYYTDGGYTSEANQVINRITPADLPTKRDQVEFQYRKARLAHKTNQLDSAKFFYKQTIQRNGEENWYFAPNACLQLGYIAVAEKEKATATLYFQKALEYKKHEYKNSIDSKAKTALAQLKRK